MSKPIDQERELFEQSERDRSPGVPLFILPASHKFRPGEYQNQYVEAAWRAWQARASVQPAGVAVPEGYALVPVEPTELMLNLGNEAAKNGGCDLYGLKRELLNGLAAMLAAAPHPVSGEQKSDMADAYCGAMEDRNIWKRRALEAEAKLRAYDQRIVDLGVLSMRTAVEKRDQPAAQDVSGLVEALQAIYDEDPQWPGDIGEGRKRCIYRIRKIAQDALRAHRAQAQGGDV